MDPLTQLPVECLQLIVKTLDKDNSLFALASLLTMNKHIASVTLPFLYRDPYRPAFHNWGTKLRNKDRITSYRMLTRTLLSRLPLASLSKALSLALTTGPLNNSTTASTTRSSFDSLAHIRHINVESWYCWDWLPARITTDSPLHQLEYILGEEFDQLYQLNPLATGYASRFSIKERTLKRYYQAVVHLDALWSLAEPILEQLQSFTIPVPQIKRYQDAIGRFKSLETVRFLTSEIFEDPFDDGSDNEARKARRDELVQDMLEFVKEHIRLFRGKLKFVICLEGEVWETSTATVEYSCQEIIPCLPAHLHHLDALDLVGWSALTFNPAILSTTKELRSLTMDMNPIVDGDCFKGFIPPTEELNQSYGIHAELTITDADEAVGTARPQWTWDWYLPLLTNLSLSVEFAYLFKFKMLHGCPALQTLILDICSLTPTEHTRNITFSDILLPATNGSINISSKSPSSAFSQQSAPQYLCLPCLTQLTLNGAWIIDDRTMSTFLTGMLPNVKKLQLADWSITTFESLIRLCRSVPQDMDRPGIVQSQEVNMDTLPVHLKIYKKQFYLRA
ncbi:hypothetical protein BGW39_007710 [Mortierella sp. 14UC]|nr:hypothetical protein BGW39_007710 [Mortierella sp. 14UC]